jgi:hypothetical protein
MFETKNNIERLETIVRANLYKNLIDFRKRKLKKQLNIRPSQYVREK